VGFHGFLMSNQYKQIVLGIIILVSIILFWYFLHQLIFEQGNFPQTAALLVLGFFTFGIAISLNSILVDSSSNATLFILSGLTVFLFFKFNVYIFGGSLIFILFLILGDRRIKRERDERLKIRVFRFLKRGLPLIFTGILVAVSIIFYFSPISSFNEELIFPRAIFDFIFKPFEGLISKNFPGYQPGTTIDELIIMSNILGVNPEQGFPSQAEIINSPEFKKLLQSNSFDDKKESLNLNEFLKNPQVVAFFQRELESQINKISPAVLKNKRDEFAKEFGIELSGNETLSDVVYKIINSNAKIFSGHYKSYLPLIFTVGLFLTLKAISIPLIWIIIIFTFVIFRLMVSANFINIKKEEVEREIIKSFNH